MQKFLFVKSPNTVRQAEIVGKETTVAPLGVVATDEKKNSIDLGPSSTLLQPVTFRRTQRLNAATGAARASAMPPAIKISPVVRRIHRFGCVTSGSYTITVLDLAGAAGGICTVANTTLRSWASAVKVHRISVWNPSTTTAVQVAEVVWFAVGTNQGKEDVRDTSVPTGITVTKPVVSSPPKGTLACFWQTTVSNTNSLVQLQVDAGSVIDVDLSFNLSNQLVSGTHSIATGTLGTVYYLPLDGPASNKLQQLGVPTTA